MTDPTSRADLKRRVDAGEWLSLAEAATLLGVPRNTVYTWTRRDKIGYRVHPMSKYRTVNPEHVKELLAKIRQEPES